MFFRFLLLTLTINMNQIQIITFASPSRNLPDHSRHNVSCQTSIISNANCGNIVQMSADLSTAKTSPTLLPSNWLSKEKSDLPSIEKRHLRQRILFQYSEGDESLHMEECQSRNSFLLEGFQQTPQKLRQPGLFPFRTADRNNIGEVNIDLWLKTELKSTASKGQMKPSSVISQIADSHQGIFSISIKQGRIMLEIHRSVSQFSCLETNKSSSRLFQRIRSKIEKKGCSPSSIFTSLFKKQQTLRESLRRFLLTHGIPFEIEEIDSLLLEVGYSIEEAIQSFEIQIFQGPRDLIYTGNNLKVVHWLKFSKGFNEKKWSENGCVQNIWKVLYRMQRQGNCMKGVNKWLSSFI